MTFDVELLEKPKTKEMYLMVGWRQWADAGSVSSGLPRFLIKHEKARKIGNIKPDGFYLFQIPGTHDLVRPTIKFKDGYPEFLETAQNEFFYAGNSEKGMIYFIGDEPHLEVERYIQALIDIAKEFSVKRIISLGGVYGELPYDKERLISCTYSQMHLKEELENLAVRFSNYHGGGSIGSYLCKRAGENDLEFISLYAFVPTYNFSDIPTINNSIHIENDYTAWLGIMRRVNHMLKLNMDLSKLEKKSEKLTELIHSKVKEIDESSPEFDVYDFLNQLNQNFEELSFQPSADFWEEELGRLFDKIDSDEEE